MIDKKYIIKCIKNHCLDVISRKLRREYNKIMSEYNVLEFNEGIILYKILNGTMYYAGYRGDKKGNFLINVLKKVEEIAKNNDCRFVSTNSDEISMDKLLISKGYHKINEKELIKCVI